MFRAYLTSEYGQVTKVLCRITASSKKEAHKKVCQMYREHRGFFHIAGPDEPLYTEGDFVQSEQVMTAAE